MARLVPIPPMARLVPIPPMARFGADREANRAKDDLDVATTDDSAGFVCFSDEA